MKKLGKKKIKYIKRNFPTLSDEEFAKKLRIPIKVIKKARMEMDLLREEEKKAKEARWLSQVKKFFSGSGKGLLKRKYLIAVVILCLIIGLVFFIPSSRNIISKSVSSLLPMDKSELNIVVIVIDTLRADHLGCYGFKEIETPNIDAIAQEGVRFDQVVSSIPLTLPSHCSIFTGTYPLFHQIRDNGGYYLDDSYTTLAEILQAKGYKTAAFISAYVLDSKWGLDQGFDYYFDEFDLTKYKRVSLSNVQRPGGEVQHEALKWLGENKEERFFAWIHYYDPHSPYTPPSPFREEYPGRPYDGEIAYVDFLIGKLENYLEEEGLLENTLLIITSDHGEGLGEHKEILHGNFIYDTTVRVPLIIRFPRKSVSNKAIKAQVRLIDIMPTILDYIGIESPEEVQGTSILSLVKNDGEDLAGYSETYYPRIHFGWSELISIRKNGYKYIDAPKPELYDLRVDPGEMNNLYQEKKEVAEQFKSELNQIIQKYANREDKKTARAQLDQETVRKLRTLGYLGSSTTTNLDQRGTHLADPKDKIDVIRLMTEAEKMSDLEQHDEAITALENLLSLDSNIVDAHLMLGNMYSKKERYEDAIEEFKKAIEINPEYDAPKINMAMAYKHMDLFDEAIAILKEVHAKEPRNNRANYHLADAYMSKKDYDNAIKYLKIGLRYEPSSPTLNAELAMNYYDLGSLEKSEENFRKALQYNPNIHSAHFTLALIYEKKRNYIAAEQEYFKEIKNNPDDFRSYFNLGKIYGRQRDFNKQIEYYKKALERYSNFAEGYFYLAKAYLDTRNTENFELAIEAATKGLEINPYSAQAPLGHYVLTDIYNRQGKRDLAQLHLQKARQLEQTLKDKGIIADSN
jgi:arylsulfatase A-like enzyme/Tfp pilus assembly protein PilF